jgi:hypothetical protein
MTITHNGEKSHIAAAVVVVENVLGVSCARVYGGCRGLDGTVRDVGVEIGV